MRILPEVKTPTDEQIRILTDDGLGFRLIRGAAGSGKTTAALMRLGQLMGSFVDQRRGAKSDEPISVLVLTFNRTLMSYVLELARSQGRFQANMDGLLNLEVNTFAGWAQSRVGYCEIMPERECKRFFQEHLLKAGIDHDMEYFVDEIWYILGRFKPTALEDYLNAARSGRGRSPAVRRDLRDKLLNNVIRPYAEFKRNSGRMDWNDLALKLASKPAQELDILIVDEAQDMSANQIRAMLGQLKNDHVCTFIVDAAQRVYPQCFAWKEVGLTVTGPNVYALYDNHRNTREVARFAAGIVENLEIGDDGVLPKPESCKHHGPLPIVIQGRYSAQIAYMMKAVTEQMAKGETTAFIKPHGGQWFDYLRQVLRARGIAYCELTRRKAWPKGGELVALSTIHSVKGLQFDHVMIPGLSKDVTPHGRSDGDGTLEKLRRLLAMGIGRARKSVILGYKVGEASSLIRYLAPETFRLIQL